VSDTGIGIQGDAQKKLFTQFFQADASTTRKYGGTGLGLAISRNIVELMGGTIGVKNNEPNGATFWFDIPLLRVQEKTSPALLPIETKTRFLIVDDNELTLSLLYTMLNSLGYSDITGATSGKAALEALHSARTKTEPFDIVLIDMIMPEMDGWRLAAEINKNREINQAQLYLMVPEGSFGADAKMKLLEWFNGYLYKPIKRRKLVELLKERRQTSIDLEIVEELDSPEGEGETAENALPAKVPASAHGATGAHGTAAAHTSAAVKSSSGPSGAKNAQNAPPSQASQETQDADGSQSTHDQSAKGLVVLIAEDHPVNRKLLKIFLERAGATVITAEDGQEATEKMGEKPFDLVFMDIQMPRLNGYEATSWIRKQGYTLPVIACTASAQQNEKEQCLLFGMTDILPKPYKRQEVIDILLKYTRKNAEEQLSARDESVFDNQSFFEIMMGDTDTAKILMGEFLEQTESHLAILKEDIATGLFEDAGKTAHMIKGSSLNITAKRLADAALVIEKNALTFSKEQLEAAYQRMCDELATLRARLIEEGYSR
jgi:CheY-like chemotaxis protein